MLQTGLQDCIEEYNSRQKGSKQISVILNKHLACSLLFQKRYFTSSEAAAGGFSAGWGFPEFCERWAASPALTFHLLTKCQSPGFPPHACCHSAVLAGCHSQWLSVLCCCFTHNICLGEPLGYMESNLRNSDCEENTHKIKPLNPAN